LAAVLFPASALASSGTNAKVSTGRASLASLAVPVLPVLAPSVPEAVGSWFETTGKAVFATLAQDERAVARDQSVPNCLALESAATKALTKHSPPSPALAYHWASALTFTAVGAGECVQALRQKDTPALRAADHYITEGALQIGYATKAMRQN
jgi:hypothetical protein